MRLFAVMRRALLILVAIVATTALERGAEAQQLAVAPPTRYAPGAGDLTADKVLDACLHLEQWPFVAARTQIFGNLQLLDGRSSYEDRHQCFMNLRSRGIKMMFEIPVLKEWCTTAAACYATLHTPEGDGLLDRMAADGATIDVLSYDEPLYTVVGPLWPYRPMPWNVAVEYAASQTAQFTQWVHRDFGSGVQVISIEPFPGWVDGATAAYRLEVWIDTVNGHCAELGTRGIDYLMLDHDWHIYGWTMDQVGQILGFAHSRGVGFSSVFIAANGGESMDDWVWYNGIMYQGQLYKDAGIVCDLYTIESWIAIPTVTLPEWQMYPAPTFMKSVYDFINTKLPPAWHLVNLQASNGQFVCAESGGGDWLYANRNTAGEWETFWLIDLNGGELIDGDPVAFESTAGQWLYVTNTWPQLGVFAESIGENETFTIVNVNSPGGKIQGGDVVALNMRSGSYDNFVSAEGGGGGILDCNRRSIGDWERFVITILW